jgi:hypothetical protein
VLWVEGVWWDLVAVYAPGLLWKEHIPAATYINGTVVRVSGQASDVIEALAGPSAGNDGAVARWFSTTAGSVLRPGTALAD